MTSPTVRPLHTDAATAHPTGACDYCRGYSLKASPSCPRCKGASLRAYIAAEVSA